jgi:carbamoyltransferase
MIVKWGVSALFHDASIVVCINDKIVFASSAERFSRIKGDKHLNLKIIQEALKYGYPNEVYWYENVFLKSLRILLVNKKIRLYNIKKYLQSFGIVSKIYFTTHHESHLYSSLTTAPFDSSNSLGVVVDAVGEFNSLTIWNITASTHKKIYKQNYPKSLGLFYSAITDLIGLTPQDEEYILMGMSSYGKSSNYIDTLKNILNEDLSFGCKHLIKQVDNKFDVAYAAQSIFEEELVRLVKKYLNITGYTKIIYSGGCALNCKANSLLAELGQLWIFPNPGDSGSSLGAIKSNNINLQNMFLGYDAGVNNNYINIIDTLLNKHPVGVINGRAEFGPRALGHRSILADPRDIKMKEIVNDIKGREQFRPFAPCILRRFASDYFHLKDDLNYSYMQYLVKCKKPEVIPAAVHVDSTSRVQIVDESNPFLNNILERWYKKTNCPVLLNTSLNIKGKPIVNGYNDLQEFNNKLIVF